MAATVATIPVLTDATVIIIFGLVVAGMATRTVRLVGGETPDDGFSITAMTGRATQITGMVTRIRSRHMPES